jgi:hypothetical protein
MGKSKNETYAERYAAYAMEQMRRYGIPASVTLAQGILESSNGESTLAKKENNHFGIKATQSWLDGGGKYGLYTDDAPNEKFCSYDSVADSYEHHSRFLAENQRYAGCFALQADDYKGWAQGLEQAGYATGGNYAASFISIIERNGLDRYDRMVMEEMQVQGRTPGEDRESHLAEGSKDYAFPLERAEFLLVTVPFGEQRCITLQADHEAVLATENNGKVVAVDAGQSLTVEYARTDGTTYQVSYQGLTSTNAKVGDTVNAGQQVGVSGDSLLFGVVQISTDGSRRDFDPAAYLADVAQKGNINLQLMHDGKDLLAKYKVTDGTANHTGLSPDEWMKKLLSSEDSGARLGYGTDPIVEMAITMFTSLMALAMQIDNKEEQMRAATEAALGKRIDLSALLPACKECVLEVQDGGRPILHIDNGSGRFSHELTASEMNRLSLVLSATGTTAEQKRSQVAAIVGSIALSGQVARNYEQGMEQHNGQGEDLQMR